MQGGCMLAWPTQLQLAVKIACIGDMCSIVKQGKGWVAKDQIMPYIVSNGKILLENEVANYF